MSVKAMSGALLETRADRIATLELPSSPIDEQVSVAVEGPITIDVENVGSFTVLCTPTNVRAMAVGFLFSEGLIDSGDDLAVLRECSDDPAVIRVQLQPGLQRSNSAQRNLLIVSSCGACGSEKIEQKIAELPVVGSSFKIAAHQLKRIHEEKKKRQLVFAQCGGTHAALIFNAQGETMSFAEDIGRHNALDKAIGEYLLKRSSPRGLGVALSGRVSFEMVSKCARAGIEFVSAVSAPTSLAIETALRARLTLVAFVRGTNATIFTGRERIIF